MSATITKPFEQDGRLEGKKKVTIMTSHQFGINYVPGTDIAIRFGRYKMLHKRVSKGFGFSTVDFFPSRFFRFLALSAITNILHKPRDKSREIP